MTQEKQKTCPTCNGEKTILGTCVCSQEWRGTQVDDGWEDCQCTPDLKCPACSGTGYTESE